MASSYKAHPVQIAMTPTQWDSINTYAERVHWKVLFDLNVQLRNGTSWDVSNAVSLLNYTATKHYRVAWGLGNGKSHVLLCTDLHDVPVSILPLV